MKNRLLYSLLAIESSLVLVLGCVLVFNRNPSAEHIYEDALHSVVEVKGTTGLDESYGTAVCIEDGSFITNYHVISYSDGGSSYIHDQIEIRSAFEEEYRIVTLLDYDPALDLALLGIETNDLFEPLTLSRERPKAGSACYAIGNAENLGISITEGIVSSTSIIINDGENDRDFIQLDITLTNGSSGSALLSSRGALIGMNTLRLRNDLGDVIYGYAYAIPIEVILSFLESES